MRWCLRLWFMAYVVLKIKLTVHTKWKVFEIFSKIFVDNTVINANGYLVCKRQDDGVNIKKWETVWRVFSFDIHCRERCVECLGFQLECEETILVRIMNKPYIHNTKFLSWIEQNKRYIEARNLAYSQFPTEFVWNQSKHRCTPIREGFKLEGSICSTWVW